MSIIKANQTTTIPVTTTIPPTKSYKRFPLADVIVAAVVLLGLAPLVWTFAASPELDWQAVTEYLFNPLILQGVAVTLMLSVVTMALGMVIGAVIAGFAISGMVVLRWLANAYVWVFRAIPLLVQLIFWFNLGLVIPMIGFFPGTSFGFGISTNDVISGIVAAILGLTLHEAAVIAEIYRGGMAGVSAGQREAGLAVGLTPGVTNRRIIFPLAFRSVVPALGNTFIGLLKATALVSVIGAGDLLTNTQRIYAQNFQVIPLLIVATVWYMVITAVFMIAQAALERWLEARSTYSIDYSRTTTVEV